MNSSVWFVSSMMIFSILLSGCATVRSTASTVTANVVDTATSITSNVASSTSTVGADVLSTATTVTTNVASTAGTTMNESVADLGEHTGLTTLVKAGTQMTPRQSYSLGRICAAKILANHEPIRSEAVSSYINILGKYLAMHSQSPQIYKGYQFILIEGEAPYAVSTPGGFVFISSGMISLTQTEDELAAILAHEIGHISLKHAEAAIQTANRLDLFGGMVFKTAGYATDFATKTVGLDKVQVLHDLKVIKALKVFDAVTDFVLNEGFNQAQELEADQEALQILRNAGYSSAALETVIAKISDDSGLGNLHPGGKKRIEAIHNGITETRVLASQSGAEEATTKTLKRFLAMKEKLKPHDLVEDRY